MSSGRCPTVNPPHNHLNSLMRCRTVKTGAAMIKSNTSISVLKRRMRSTTFMEMDQISSHLDIQKGSEKFTKVLPSKTLKT